MKRLHIHISVDDFDKSVEFYSTLFASAPTKQKPDYAKWILDDPSVNFVLGSRSSRKGVDHLGIQVETDDELSEVYDRLKKADAPKLEEGEVECCYAQTEKSWIADPTGVSWEVFRTLGDAAQYGCGVHAHDPQTAHPSNPEDIGPDGHHSEAALSPRPRCC